MSTAAKSSTLPLMQKLDEAAARHASLRQALSDPAVLSDGQRVVAMSKEAGRLESLVNQYDEYRKSLASVEELTALAGGGDPEMAELANAELPGAHAKVEELLESLKDRFLEAEEAPVASFFLELRAGTGGDEAALFVGDLFEMYRKFVEGHGWRWEVADFSPSERGGFKEVIINVRGDGAWRALRFEGGGHRVQRVPETEAQGRIHTSAATVAVLPEMPDVKIDIKPSDVEEQGCRGGGPGGQNVNKVETGWRITHKPTGLQFKITELRSQGQNKERAWALLRATLYEREQAKQHAAVTSARRAMTGSGDRSQRIRTYNFPQNRCTDHRLGGEGGEKNFNLDQILAGDLDALTAALNDLDRQQRLANL